jgi:hypothetical protein
MPPPTTAQVATVRHSTSVPVNCQIASRHATTATRMQPLVVQNEIFVTTRGLRKPRFIGRVSLAGYSEEVKGYLGLGTVLLCGFSLRLCASREMRPRGKG